MKTTELFSVPRLAASLLVACGLVGCAPYKFNTVNFELASPIPPATDPAPKTFINTNTSITGPFGGSVKSKKPYSIHIDHADVSFTVAAFEFTKVVVTYHDGTVDPGSAAIKLPLRMNARDHVAVNSVSNPENPIVRTKMRIISGSIPNVISRDEPLAILIEGHFIKDDGGTIPFTIRESYKPEFDNSTKPWAEVVSDI